MKPKNTIIIALTSLLLASLVWSMIFWLPDVGTEVARVIYANPVTDALSDAYENFFAPLLCVLYSFGNLIFAVLELFGMYVKRQTKETDEKLTIYWVYTFVSLGALVIHYIGFHYIFQIHVFST